MLRTHPLLLRFLLRVRQLEPLGAAAEGGAALAAFGEHESFLHYA